MSLITKLNKVQLLPAEKTMVIVSTLAGAIAVMSFLWHGQNVDWAAYGSIMALVAGMVGMGIFYRASGRSERIGAATICAGLFIYFTICLSLFNYHLLPTWRTPIDPQLARIDQFFGYYWPSIIEWAGQNPTINNILRIAYVSTMPQLALLVVILGLSGRIKELHVLILSITITATFTICWWGFFPSFGASSIYQLPAAMEALASPELGTAYGAYLVSLGAQGPQFITPSEIKGLIGFPSYHTVLAVTALYASRTIKWIFPIYLVLNILILPGVFVHGGHHMVDLIGGLVIAIGGLYIARNAVYKQYKKFNLPEVVAG